MLITNANIDTSTLTNQAIEEIILQLKQELKERENAEIESLRDKAIEALRKLLQKGGYVYLETYNGFSDDDGYLRIECLYPQDVQPDTDNPRCINISAN